MSTAAYIAQRDAFGRRVQWLVEIDLDRCTLNYTTAPCTAVDAGDGSRCHYTFKTCQDVANYTRGTRTLRFCLNEVPFPDDAYAVWPHLRRFIPVPQRIDPSKLFVYPEKITLEFALDYDPPALDSDKTLFNTALMGEFWRNLRARNPNYVNRAVRIKRGFYASGFVLTDFEQVGPTYKLKEWNINADGATLTAESPLADLNKRKIPNTISEDNTLQGNITNVATSVVVRDAAEYPDPTAYTLNDIYIKIESEVMQVTARDTGTDTLTVVRGRWGTSNVAHTAGVKVLHVVCFGVDNGASTPTEITVSDAIRWLLEWAGVATADVDTDSFTDLTAAYWPETDVRALFAKPEAISKLIQPIRDARGVILYIDSSAKWAVQSAGPADTVSTLTDDHFALDTVEVDEDEEDRVTRVGIWYAPNAENPREPRDYDKGVFVIDTDLEGVNAYGDVKERVLLDPWLSTATPVANVRNVARRLITRLRNGVRTYTFRVDLKDATLNVGDHREIETRHVLNTAGTVETRPAMVVAKREVALGLVEYEAVDVNYSGRYLRMGASTMAEAYDSATSADKAYGYWGDADNRLGTINEPGYIFW